VNLTLTKNCSDSDVAFLRQMLLEYNQRYYPSAPVIEPVRFILRNDAQEILGGLSGIIYMDCLTIDLLWVCDAFRGKGYGKGLLIEAEKAALSRRCRIILLDTFSFQAPDFYLHNGYAVHSVVKDCPVQNHDRVYMKKIL